MSRTWLAWGTALSLAGCGLALDYEPRPDGGTGIDSGSVGADAGASDAGPVRCLGPDDCGGIDNDPCDGTTRCDLATGECVVDPAPACGMNEPCTTARCDSSAGGCVSEPVACDDGVACTRDACDPSTGGCRFEPDSSLCASAVACLAPLCTSTGCDVVDSCAVISPDGRCDESSGTCVFADCEASCVRIGPCSEDAQCDAIGRCVQRLAPAGTSCHNDQCNFGACTDAGRCDSAPIDCEDGSPCTFNGCDPATGCTTVRRDRNSPCDTDNDRCTLEICDGEGQCVDGIVVACTDADPFDCFEARCHPATGICASLQIAPGRSCSDRIACTDPDRCTASGACVGGDTCAAIPSGSICDAQRCDAFSGDCVTDDHTGEGCGVANVCDGRSCCLLGTSDCDANPSNGCECSGTCARLGPATVGVCSPGACSPPCRADERCCDCTGRTSCVGLAEPCTCAM